METIQAIAALISMVGFPVVMCGALFWYMIEQNNQHAEESKSMREAVNALEKAIIQLTDRLEKGE